MTVRGACVFALAALLPGCSRNLATLPDAPGAGAPPVREAAADAERTAAAPLLPFVDHHRHLMSPAAARLIGEAPLPAVAVPEALARVLRERTEHWNDSAALAALYTEHATLLDPTGPRWVQGRRAVAERVARYFRRAPYTITPVAWRGDARVAYIAGYLTRDQEAGHFTHVQLTLDKGDDGAWRIASESLFLGGPPAPEPVTAEQLVGWLDEAGMRRAVVLSVAYWFGQRGRELEDELARVRAENDWTAEQAARYPGRLVAFCSFNPLKEYALAELERCAAHPHLKGIKLHFANSGVDVLDPAHVEKLRQVFRATNRHGLPIVAHLWIPGGTYGRRHSEVFLDSILPEAPDVVVQVAHFAGGGGGYPDDALAPFAEAIAAGDPRMRNVYFDVTAVVDEQRLPLDMLFRFADRMREVGLERILFGSDMAPPPASEPWARFRGRVPLTDAEFRVIADNIAPYLR